MIYFSSLYYYLGTAVFLIYLFAIFYFVLYSFRLDIIKLSYLEISLYVCLVFLFLLKLYDVSLYDNIVAVRFYFGFTIFYIYFKASNKPINIERLLMLLASATISRLNHAHN